MRYGPEELPGAISRIVRWRWPLDRLLLTVPCIAEWPVVRDRWSPPFEDAPLPDLEGEEVRVNPGALGVTNARIVYHDHDRPGLWFRVAALTFAFVAVAGFIVGDPITPLSVAVAVVLALGARLIEALGLGSGSVELGRIRDVDRGARRIHGVDRWGISYRLRLGEDDFDEVARLLRPAA